ncbi:MAG: hypothetical protein LBS92_07885 [Candidatus Methanoplasma sp.]|nr:hypothetical protein [Candidatus Methanoplasma sp.]
MKEGTVGSTPRAGGRALSFEPMADSHKAAEEGAGSMYDVAIDSHASAKASRDVASC